jgi:WD40 repeat protein
LSTIIVNQGKLYVGGGVDFGIYVYDVDSTNPVRVLRGAMNSILSMELHDDFLIASGSQGIIHMWNLTSGLQVAQYQG